MGPVVVNSIDSTQNLELLRPIMCNHLFGTVRPVSVWLAQCMKDRLAFSFSILAQISAPIIGSLPKSWDIPKFKVQRFLELGSPMNYLFSPSSALASLSRGGPTGIMTLGTITLLFLQPCSQETTQHGQLRIALCCPTTLLSAWLCSKPSNVASRWMNQSLSSQSSHRFVFCPIINSRLRGVAEKSEGADGKKRGTWGYASPEFQAWREHDCYVKLLLIKSKGMGRKL